VAILAGDYGELLSGRAIRWAHVKRRWRDTIGCALLGLNGRSLSDCGTRAPNFVHLFRQLENLLTKISIFAFDSFIRLFRLIQPSHAPIAN
jgi:hypothetical protein